MALPMSAIKAVAEYIINTRPESKKREIFLQLHAPHAPVSGRLVGKSITDWMHQCGVQGTAYQLRHTYALNLLTSGATVFEIKEMLGHDRLQTTGRYLSIQTEMMREVLFAETI
jgi:site-specific recombinase XerD